MWVTERGSKTRTGGKDSMPERYFDPRIYATNTDRCPVRMFKAYIDRKPEPMKQPESPFYLAHIINPKSSVWYKASPLGVNSLGNFMKSMAVKAKLAGKHTNHSARRTMITNLCHENINPLDISQLSGHKNLKSIDTNSEASEEQQRRMSLAISGRSGGHVKPFEEKKQLNLQQSSSTESHHLRILPCCRGPFSTTVQSPSLILEMRQLATTSKNPSEEGSLLKATKMTELLPHQLVDTVFLDCRSQLFYLGHFLQENIDHICVKRKPLLLSLTCFQCFSVLERV